MLGLEQLALCLLLGVLEFLEFLHHLDDKLKLLNDVVHAGDVIEGEPQVAVDLLRVVQAAAALAAHVVRRLRRGARAEVEQAAEGRATRAREETVAVAVGVAGRGVGAGKVEGLRVRLLVHAGQLLEELGRRVGRIDLRQHEERGQHFRRRKVVPPLKTALSGAFLALANRPPPGPPLHTAS